jgi:hypothetical protein
MADDSAFDLSQLTDDINDLQSRVDALEESGSDLIANTPDWNPDEPSVFAPSFTVFLEGGNAARVVCGWWRILGSTEYHVGGNDTNQYGQPVVRFNEANENQLTGSEEYIYVSREIGGSAVSIGHISTRPTIDDAVYHYVILCKLKAVGGGYQMVENNYSGGDITEASPLPQ